jgi:hypothetical protein
MDEIVWKKLENLEMAGLVETAEKLLPPLAACRTGVFR